MDRIESLKEKAKKNLKTVILPEHEDDRVVKAACMSGKEGIARIIMLGKKDDISKRASAMGVDAGSIEIIDPDTYSRKDEIITSFYELRKHKGISLDEARNMVMSNLVFYGAMLTKFGVGDGFVAGASHTTADVARAGLYCLKLDRKVGVLCSSFAVEVDNKSLGAEGIFIYGDCGIIPDPVPNQLAGIAIACGELINVLFDIEPKVALLSYSTKGSAEGKSIDKVRAALQLIKERMPDLAVDGELQGDSAIVPEVASIKCKDSKVAGKANVLVFPNLDAGNICYKLTQRICGARVVGPLMMGFNHPASDLSRGCGIQEIVDAVTITAVRAQRKPAE